MNITVRTDRLQLSGASGEPVTFSQRPCLVYGDSVQISVRLRDAAGTVSPSQGTSYGLYVANNCAFRNRTAEGLMAYATGTVQQDGSILFALACDTPKFAQVADGRSNAFPVFAMMEAASGGQTTRMLLDTFMARAVPYDSSGAPGDPVKYYTMEEMDALYSAIQELAAQAGEDADRAEAAADSIPEVTVQVAGKYLAANSQGTGYEFKEGSGGGTGDYSQLTNKPQIGGVTLSGNKTAGDLGLVASVSGKGLSTEDYTTAEKTKLAGIAAGAEANVQSDWNATDTASDAFIANKPTIPIVNNPTIAFTQGGVAKGSFTLNQTSGATIALDAGGGGGTVTAEVVKVGDTATITVTDSRGTTTASISDGTNGQDGTAATIAVGTVTTGAAGSQASVVNSGTSSAAVFDFVIPRGAQGTQGPQGNPGINGTDGQDGYSPSAFVAKVGGTATITIIDKIGTTTATVQDGAPGAAGQAATIAVGTVTTGAAGSSASVTNSGTSAAAVFDFIIPRGANGQDGAQGPQGPQGNPGTNGQDGTAATIAVGTVTTGAAGSQATVVNRGTSAAAVFDFSIPRGADGASVNPIDFAGVTSNIATFQGIVPIVGVKTSAGKYHAVENSDVAFGQSSTTLDITRYLLEDNLASFGGTWTAYCAAGRNISNIVTERTPVAFVTSPASIAEGGIYTTTLTSGQAIVLPTPSDTSKIVTAELWLTMPATAVTFTLTTVTWIATPDFTTGGKTYCVVVRWDGARWLANVAYMA